MMDGGEARSEWKQLEELNLTSNKHDEIKLSPLHPNTETVIHTQKHTHLVSKKLTQSHYKRVLHSTAIQSG